MIVQGLATWGLCVLICWPVVLMSTEISQLFNCCVIIQINESTFGDGGLVEEKVIVTFMPWTQVWHHNTWVWDWHNLGVTKLSRKTLPLFPGHFLPGFFPCSPFWAFASLEKLMLVPSRLAAFCCSAFGSSFKQKNFIIWSLKHGAVSSFKDKTHQFYAKEALHIRRKASSS